MIVELHVYVQITLYSLYSNKLVVMLGLKMGSKNGRKFERGILNKVESKTGRKTSVLAFLKCMEGSVLALLKCMDRSVLVPPKSALSATISGRCPAP